MVRRRLKFFSRYHLLGLFCILLLLVASAAFDDVGSHQKAFDNAFLIGISVTSRQVKTTCRKKRLETVCTGQQARLITVITLNDPGTIHYMETRLCLAII